MLKYNLLFLLLIAAFANPHSSFSYAVSVKKESTPNGAIIVNVTTTTTTTDLDGKITSRIISKNKYSSKLIIDNFYSSLPEYKETPNISKPVIALGEMLPTIAVGDNDIPTFDAQGNETTYDGQPVSKFDIVFSNNTETYELDPCDQSGNPSLVLTQKSAASGSFHKASVSFKLFRENQPGDGFRLTSLSGGLPWQMGGDKLQGTASVLVATPNSEGKMDCKWEDRDGGYSQFPPTPKILEGAVQQSDKRTGKRNYSSITPETKKEFSFAGMDTTEFFDFLKNHPSSKAFSMTGYYDEVSNNGNGTTEIKEESSITLTFGLEEKDGVTVVGPSSSNVPGELLEYTAVVKPESADGTFDQFEIVTDDGEKPFVQLNQGGKKPKLQIYGNAKVTGKTKIYAVFSNSKGEKIKSLAHEVNFCFIQKPLLPNTNSLMGIDKYCYDGTAAGYLEIKAKETLSAYCNGKEIKPEDLDWEILPNENGMFEMEKQPGSNEVLFKSTKLPLKNTDFGEKKIIVKYVKEGCDCMNEEAVVKVFFRRDEKNNPEGFYPNWLFYWRQTKAWVDLQCSFSYKTNGFPAPKNGGTPQVGELAKYEPYDDIMYLSPEIVTSEIIPTDGKVRSGIDGFATCLRHENQHRTDYIEWWGFKMANYSSLDDCDGDEVPNKVENNMAGCNDGCYAIHPVLNAAASSATGANCSCDGRPKNLGPSLPDNEVNAYWAGWKWVVGTADKEDWSWPGKQCGCPNP